MQGKTKINHNDNRDFVFLNERINYPNVRVISEKGRQLGILSISKALQLAQKEGLDLILVNSKSTPPVCRILDYGKYKFDQEKRARKARKKQHIVSIKEVKMRYKIETHDYNVRLNQALRFLEAGNKVKATITFRGREIQHLHLAIELLNKMSSDLKNIAEVQQKPSREGKSLSMLLVSRKN